MLDGFGLFPVSIRIDFASYDGPPEHVLRFANGTGWLWVGEAIVTSGGEAIGAYSHIVGCMENDVPIPDFMAGNLLCCTCSLPEECFELPPQSLIQQVQLSGAAISRRWLRETDERFQDRFDEFSRTVEAAEGWANAEIAASERSIASLRRHRRTEEVTEVQKAEIDHQIEYQEAHQVDIQHWLFERLRDLRREHEAEEQVLLNAIRAQISFHQHYCVHWQDADHTARLEHDNWARRLNPKVEAEIERSQMKAEISKIDASLNPDRRGRNAPLDNHVRRELASRRSALSTKLKFL